MKNNIIIFAGPGRAGTTFIQKLFYSNSKFIKDNSISLPIIKETYIFNRKSISVKTLNKFFPYNGNTYIDFSNLQYKNIENIFKHSDNFNNVHIVLFNRNVKSWLRSLLVFEMRKGNKITKELIDKKLSEIDLSNFIDPENFLINSKIKFHFFQFDWIIKNDKIKIRELVDSIFGNSSDFIINFKKINESITPKIRFIGKLTKSLAKLLRYFGAFKILEKLKSLTLVKIILFKKTDENLNPLNDFNDFNDFNEFNDRIEVLNKSNSNLIKSLK
jgi:hypothetical protein